MATVPLDLTKKKVEVCEIKGSVGICYIGAKFPPSQKLEGLAPKTKFFGSDGSEGLPWSLDKISEARQASANEI